MPALDLERSIGVARGECVEEGEMIGDRPSPDLGVKLLGLGHEHPARLFEGEEHTRQTPSPGGAMEHGVEADVGLDP